MMFEAEIERGIAWLDEVNPDWRDKINLGTLALSSLDHCVLGQVFGSYEEGIRIAFPNLVNTRPFTGSYAEAAARAESYQWAARHGFGWAHGYPGGFGSLTEGWKSRLSQRRLVH
jgi:hypothetical protein